MSSQPFLEELSIDQIINEIKVGKFHYKLLLMQYFITFQEVSQCALPGIILISISNEFSLTKTEISIYGTFEYMGFFLGSLLTGKINDTLGRRNGILIFQIIWMFSIFLSILSQNIYFFMISRCITSLSFMVVLLSGYSLISEIWPQKSRGIVLNFLAFIVVLSYILIALLARILTDDLKTVNWRTLFLIFLIILAVSFFLNLSILEESPRYDLFIGKRENAFKTIEKMAFENMQQTEFLKDGRKEQLELWVNNFKIKLVQTLQNDENSKKKDFFSSYRQLFQGSYKKITIITFILWIVISSNSFGLEFILPTVLSKVSDDLDKNPLIMLAFINGLVLPFMLPVIIMVEHKSFGRKKTLSIVFFMMGIGGFFTFFRFFPGPIFWIFIFKLSVQCSFMLIYLFTTELYPTSMRTHALGDSSAISRIGVMVIIWIVVFLSDFGTFSPFLLFGCLGFLACYILNLLPYETLNENIDRIIESP